MKVIVTGANGFLGSWVCRRLIEEGHEVFALVRGQKSDISELNGAAVQFRYGDVTNLPSLIDAFSDIQVVFHLAGVVGYRDSDRQNMIDVNIHGTENVISACKKLKIENLVYASSVVTVGAGFNPTEILNENSKYNLSKYNFGYFETKRAAENLVIQSYKNNEIRPIIFNPSTIYGRGDARKGSRKVQIKVAQGKFKLYPTGGASVAAIEDVIDGIMLAWNKGRPGERYILSGENLLVKDIFKIIAEVAGVEPPSIQLPKPLILTLGHLGDFLEKFGFKSPISFENAMISSLYNWFDCSKARNELGYKPRPAQFAITNSVEWMKENGLLNK